MKKRLKVKRLQEEMLFAFFYPVPKNWKEFKAAIREEQANDFRLRINCADLYGSMVHMR